MSLYVFLWVIMWAIWNKAEGILSRWQPQPSCCSADHYKCAKPKPSPQGEAPGKEASFTERLVSMSQSMVCALRMVAWQEPSLLPTWSCGTRECNPLCHQPPELGDQVMFLGWQPQKQGTRHGVILLSRRHWCSETQQWVSMKITSAL